MADRLTDLLRAEADTLDIPRPPTEAILRDGRDAKRRAPLASVTRLSERRRAPVMVLVGVAASVVAVTGVALSMSGTGTTADDVANAPTAYSSISDAACPPNMIDSGQTGGSQCVLWPGPGGLEEALKTELLSADAAQRQAIQDNRITQAEYRAGFERYRACLSDRGYQLGNVDQTGVVFDFTVPNETVASGADETCYLRHFKAVDMTWQMLHA
ncbi:MAG: hypothetical protein ABWY81_04470 [Jiangellaceae bacterium]